MISAGKIASVLNKWQKDTIERKIHGMTAGGAASPFAEHRQVQIISCEMCQCKAVEAVPHNIAYWVCVEFDSDAMEFKTSEFWGDRCPHAKASLLPPTQFVGNLPHSGGVH